MAGERRSSRARVSQPPHSTSNASAASSTSSGQVDKNTRAGRKASSPRKSTPSGSQSSEGLEEPAATTTEDLSQSRRKKRGQADDTDKAAKQQIIEISNDMEEAAEDDEAVRCVCGYEDYPGPPPPSDEDVKGIKDSGRYAPITDAELTDDLAGFFLQCDVCKVWQHGACVGIKNETTAPEEYFCEQCRKDLHKLSAASNGQRYSQYLPLYQTQSRRSSRAGSFSKDGTRSPRGGSKSGRPSSAVQSAKRRSTMNSRDAAYDEEEQLRQAIEASKGGEQSESVDGGMKNGKRARSDSEEKQVSTKRQRTTSDSSSPPRNQPRLPSHNGDEECHNLRGPGQKKIRGAAARNHREKLDREEKEKMRKEAATSRQIRLERRKLEEVVEDNPPPTGRGRSKLPIEPLWETPTISKSAAESPSSLPPPPASHKKGGRPPNARKGKLGRNQYTKDKEPVENDHPSPGGSQSRDTSRQDEPPQSNSNSNNHHQRGTNNSTTNDGRPSKAKSLIHSRITWPEMRRRVESYLNFISQTQIEMAQDPTFLNRSSSGGESNGAVQEMLKGLASEISVVKDRGESDEYRQQQQREFKDLSVVEMMDYLTREMIKWQKDFAA